MKTAFDIKIEKSRQLLSITIHAGSPNGSGGPPDRRQLEDRSHPHRLRRPLAAGHPAGLLRRRIPLRATSSGPSPTLPAPTDLLHNGSSRLRLAAVSSLAVRVTSSSAAPRRNRWLPTLGGFPTAVTTSRTRSLHLLLFPTSSPH
ncbi:hypothetical protein GUJ93_ZPchr0007g5443 [Zizania palustris]|uniref:Uncharacterized protein n=1 Tax=Zizania palustris TaxID=103762 RepID=A0A8J5W568_ZIZPA|nr:hypothetical protein GUJ93_ZPchr0007g5443 [Zizania palustris]